MERSGSNCTVKNRGNDQTNETGKDQKPKTHNDPQIPQPDLRFASQKNGETTEGPNKNNHTKIATRQRGNPPSMPQRNACTVTKTNSEVPQNNQEKDKR